MAEFEIKAHFGNLEILKNNQVPDTFIYNSKECIRPKDTFVISKNLDGSIISKYGDEIWDLTPYRLVGHTGTSRIDFCSLNEDQIPEAKWVVFVLLFFADTGRATGLGISTLMTYMKFIKVLFKFSAYHNANFFDFFNQRYLIEHLINHLHTRNLLRSFRTIAYHFYNIGESRVKAKVLLDTIYELVDYKINSLAPDKQYPVIPPRIYNEIIKQLDMFFIQYQQVGDNFSKFLTNIVANDQFARSLPQQRKLGFLSAESHEPNFKAEVINFGLDEYFSLNNITNINSLFTYISRLQHACKLMVHIYSGMRSGEVVNLKVGCLHTENTKTGMIYNIQGETSKLIGQKKSDSWVTSSKVNHAIKIIEEIALKIASKIDLKAKDTPLFISTGYLFKKWKPHKSSTNEPIRLTKTSDKNQEFYNLIDLSNFKLTHEDCSFLEMIDPFRAWNYEKNFQEGDIWRFTTHQFRRSLAYYVSQSSLVSLPSLRRQLKHITRDMTLYYCQAKDNHDDSFISNEVSKFLNNNKYKADSCAYSQDILDSNEPLYGAGGKHIDKNIRNNPVINIYSDNRNELEQKFKNGEIAYKTTPLGACTTIKPCLKKASLEIAACVSCEKAIIKKSKLEKVINKQKDFLNNFDDTDCVEFRSEKAELDQLVNFYSIIDN